MQALEEEKLEFEVFEKDDKEEFKMVLKSVENRITDLEKCKIQTNDDLKELKIMLKSVENRMSQQS